MPPKTGLSYRYTIAFPRVFDGPRPDWPLDLIDRFREIAGVVDVSFPELSAAWRKPEGGTERSESRRRMIFVATNNAKQAQADSTRDAIYDVVGQIKRDVRAGSVTVVRWPVELQML